MEVLELALFVGSLLGYTAAMFGFRSIQGSDPESIRSSIRSGFVMRFQVFPGLGFIVSVMLVALNASRTGCQTFTKRST